MLTGFKTFATGLSLAVLPQAVSFATSFDFSKTFGVSPNAASVIGLVMIGLRAVTSTGIFKPS